ncbi:response regulator transcription factor [Pseudomonas sp. sp1636]|uniref:response regulator n=1 Tax=Pseudomonas sp. sp1636 TaxID=3036707 RepID=UPI0025A52022|nr:response regulator transcription factor [Pseudomonas sp. sp1636]MDM8350757.1 response regulator transcription factor [Pseudomonas sp. sp1636]
MNDKIRIGIVDDHPLLRQGVATTLQKEADFDVVAQGDSADEAREIAARCIPDVLLMDVNMPGDSFAAVRAISKAQPAVNVLILTVSESENDAFAALESGARGYVLKGVSGPELVLAIRSVAKGETFITPEFASRLLSHLRKHESEARGVELTCREEQVIREVAEGLTNREVAAKLGLSEKTVKYYMTIIMQKFHARNRVEAVTAARRQWDMQKGWDVDIRAR